MPVGPHHAFAAGPSYSRPQARRRRIGRAMGALAHRLPDRLRGEGVWRVFDARAVVAADCRLGPNAYCHNRGPRERVRVGAGTVCRGVLRREDFGDGTIRLGENVYVGDDCIVSSSDRVEIGDLTLLGHGVQVFDNNSHPVDAELREADWRAVRHGEPRNACAIGHAPVVVGSRVWIGFNAIVLKGVTIGDGAVVAAGSVVTSDVESGAIVAGNPARPVRTLAPNTG